jgi:PilZ domain
MTRTPTRDPDRRHHARIEPKGTVVIHVAEAAYRGRLVNIGAGGIYATVALGAHVVVESVVDVELRFDGALAIWQRVAGRISRIDSAGAAIAFDTPTTPLLLRMIDELTTASHASARVISVVLIDANAARRGVIATGFGKVGCDVMQVATPLEAIVRLGESHFEPDVIAVANSESTAAADEMRAFVERDHASSMLVTIGPELLDPAGLANWLSSSTSTANLPGRIRELLFASGDGRNG